MLSNLLYQWGLARKAWPSLSSQHSCSANCWRNLCSSLAFHSWSNSNPRRPLFPPIVFATASDPVVSNCALSDDHERKNLHWILHCACHSKHFFFIQVDSNYYFIRCLSSVPEPANSQYQTRDCHYLKLIHFTDNLDQGVAKHLLFVSLEYWAVSLD